MLDVAIVGAGELGGSLAHLLAVRHVVRTIRLVDETGQIAAGKALDLMQSSAVSGFATVVSGATDVTAAAGAAVIALADRANGEEWQGDEGLLLLKRLSHFAADSIIVCAGASQRDLIERGVRHLGIDRGRLFGSAPEALAAAVRAMIALETNGSPKDIALTVLGVPPADIVVPWEDATIGGFSVTRMLSVPARRRIADRIGPLWPPGPRALASAAAKAVAGLLGGSRQRITAFAAPDDSNGRRARAAAVPLRLSAGGVEPLEIPPLDVRDQVALDRAVLL